MLGENKVLMRMFSLTETCKTQSNHQAHEIIIPQLSQCHTVAHRILRWSMRLLHLMTLVCCFSLCYQLLAKNNIDQEYNRVKISFFIIEISVGSFHLPKCDLFLPSSALQQHTLWISSLLKHDTKKKHLSVGNLHQPSEESTNALKRHEQQKLGLCPHVGVNFLLCGLF